MIGATPIGDIRRLETLEAGANLQKLSKKIAKIPYLEFCKIRRNILVDERNNNIFRHLLNRKLKFCLVLVKICNILEPLENSKNFYKNISRLEGGGREKIGNRALPLKAPI